MHNWKKDVLIPNDFFNFQLQKLNKEQHATFDDCMYKKRMHPNQLIQLFFIGGVGIGKTFTFLLLIHGFLKHYNKKLGSDPLKQKAILMVYTSKTTYNIDGTTIHLGLSLPLN